jgi:hypothetical protein
LTVSKKIIVTSVKNEAPFILEWVAYHRAIGFDRIIVCSNDCSDGTDGILQALAANDVILHISHTVSVGVSPQLQAARLIMEENWIRDGDWVIWLDADEFLNVRTGARDVDALIDTIGTRKGMLINWRLFGDGGQVPFRGRLIAPEFSNCNKRHSEANRCIKTFFRVGNGITGFQQQGVHRPKTDGSAGLMRTDFLNGKGAPLADGYAKHSRWLSGDDRGKDSSVLQDEIGFEFAQINHYMARTPEMFWLKQSRGRGWAVVPADGKNDRHTFDLYQKINTNQVIDQSILHWQPATNAELKQLERLKGVAKAVALSRIKVATALAPFLESEFAAKAITSREFALTLPDDAAELLMEEYAKAKCILEYGSGGSTFIAARNPEVKVLSVESDWAWSGVMRQALMREGLSQNAIIHWCDIGPTKGWGRPKTDVGWEKYHHYPLGVWDLPNFQHPDLVLIDGRFRIGCFLACLFKSTKPMTVLWDDYIDRKEFAVVEKYLKPAKLVGRMALFKTKPMAFPTEDLSDIVAQFSMAG